METLGDEPELLQRYRRHCYSSVTNDKTKAEKEVTTPRGPMNSQASPGNPPWPHLSTCTGKPARGFVRTTLYSRVKNDSAVGARECHTFQTSEAPLTPNVQSAGVHVVWL